MVDKNKRDTQTDGGAGVQPNTPIGASLIAANKPESVSITKENNPKKKGHYGEYVIWFLIPVGFLVFLSWGFTRELLDKHNGAVSAIGTIAIMLLTIAYVRYSRHQWQVMDGQLEQMRQQLPEIQKSAKAAQDSADVATDAQRSWLLENGISPQELNTAWIQEFVFNFRVIGHSPVRIEAAKFRYHLVNSRPNGSITEADLPEVPDYGAPNTVRDIPQLGRVLAPDPSSNFQVGARLDNLYLTPEDLVAINQWQKFLCAYGFIKYRDAFSKAKMRETRFCFIYDMPRVPLMNMITKERANPDQFIVGGPESYNEVT
jgi:hypothetical protein